MATINDYLKYAETTFAAYADLTQGQQNVQALVTADMATAQAIAFNSQWNVLSQSASDPSGFSAVLLQNVGSGEKVLAIRGTEGSQAGADFITDFIDIAAGQLRGMPQYIALDAFYQQLLATGKLGSSEQVTVTGHSLGGFLAQGFAAQHDSAVRAVYTYNAPGFGGAIAQVLEYMGLTDASAANSKIINVRATDGFSVTAGLGQVLGTVQLARIEGTSNPIDFHSIKPLSDSLAIYDTYARLWPTISMEQAGTLFVASGNDNRRQENALDVLRTVFIGSASNDTNKTPTGDRDRFYINLQALQGNAAYKALSGQVQLSLAEPGFASLAQGSTNTALAYRYALLELLPLAVIATTEAQNQTLYSAYAQRLSLYDEATGLGELTPSWLVDRALMLDWLVLRNERNLPDTLTTGLTGRPIATSVTFEDKSTTTRILVGSALVDQRQQIVFGGDASEAISGFGLADHLYGGAGNDVVNGQGGADYLEGNAGDDQLDGGDGSDVLAGGEGTDIYAFNSSFGRDIVVDADGAGVITWNGGALLPQGLKVFDGVWQSADRAVTYTLSKNVPGADGVERSDLVISFRDSSTNRIVIRGWNEGARNLGITFGGDFPVPQTTRTVMGDFKKKEKLDDNGNPTGLYELVDGNYVDDGAQGDALDQIVGGTANEAIYGLGGDDAILGRQGEDYLDGGAGSDVLQGGLGSDRILGRDGSDVIYGSSQGGLAMPTRLDFTPPSPPTGSVVLGQGFNWWSTANTGNGPIYSFGLLSNNVARDDGDGDTANAIDSGADADLVMAGQGDDVVVLGDGNDEAVGMAGSDVVLGGLGNDSIEGDGPVGPDAEWVVDAPGAQHGADVLVGNEGNDTLLGQGNDDILLGGADDDVLWGDDSNVTNTPAQFHGSDMLFGGTGNDSLIGGALGDELYGESGNDALWGDSGNKSPGDVGYFDVALHGNDTLYGGAGNDSLFGEGGADRLFGGAGNDRLEGGAGADILEGGGGADILLGGAASDTYVVNASELTAGSALTIEDTADGNVLQIGGNVTLGSVANDGVLRLLLGNPAEGRVLEIYGGFAGAAENLVIDGQSITARDWIAANVTQALSLEGLESGGHLYGGGGNDTLVGSDEQDKIYGASGNDELAGLGGMDTLVGDAGNDELQGDGDVSIVAAALHGADLLDGGEGNDTLVGFGGDDTLTGGVGNDWLTGEDDLDGTTVSTLTGDDRLDGGLGNDTLLGGNGADELDGGEAQDMQFGGAGNDVLISDGQDYLAGGSGDDSYVVTTRPADPVTGQVSTTVIHDTEGTSLLRIDGVPLEQLQVVNLGGQVIVSAGAAGTVALSQGTSLESVRLVSDGAGSGLTARELVQRDDANGFIHSVRLATDGQLLTTASATEAQNLKGTSTADLLEGGTAVDDLDAGDGDDMLRGNAGRDLVRGGLGSDTLHGGTGDDNLFGGKEGASDTSTDTFVFDLGDGNDSVEFGLGGQGILRFGAGVTRESLIITNLGGATASTRLLKIEYSLTDSVIIEAGSDASLASIEFADGSSISRADLLGMTPAYTAADDVLYGAADADLLDGGVGNDTLNGLGGSDTLTGGEGNDVLNGGAGNNTYLFAPGSGTDEIVPTTDESATLRFADVDYGQMRASLQGSDLWLIQPGGERVKVAGYANAPFSAQWNVVARDGSVHTIGELLAASEAADAFAARRDTFLAEQRVRLGSTPVEQNLDPAAPTATYRHFRTEESVTVETVTYQRVPQYEETVSYRVIMHPAYLAFLQGTATPAEGGSSQNIPDGTYEVPPWYVETTTENRFVGWKYVRSTSTSTVVTATNSQVTVTGTAGDDWLTPDNSTAADGHALFRGRVDTGDGDDVVEFNGQSQSWYRQWYEGNGAWIELGAGNDLVAATDLDDVIVGGTGSDTLHGNAGSDTYLVAADGSGVDTIHDDLDWLPVDWGAGVDRSGWNFNDELEVSYAGGAGQDRVEFDSTVQRALLSHRFEGNTLQLVHDGALFLEIDYRPESLAAHLSGAASGAMPGVESFRFSDGTVISLRELVATTPIAPPAAVLGSDGDDLLIGTSGDELMLGLAGNDTLNGGAGADTMEGGAGNDIYVVDSDSDVVSENTDEGVDLVRSTVSYTLGDDVENLTLFGTEGLSGSGNALDNTLIGNDGGNALSGGDGNDALNGGAGVDTLQGGAGDDLYTVDAAGDVVVESPGEGVDRVRASVSYALGDNLENLTLIGTEGLSGSGNALDNTLIGNDANNALSGGDGNDLLNGGLGADTMQGGTGSDTYVVDSAADVVSENSGEGIDLVRSTVGYVLGNNVENLTLFGTEGLSGSGNTLDNILVGNDGSNVLTGGGGNDTLNGGAGLDTLQGGVGDDTYTVDQVDDVITESEDQGIDLVRASVAYTLGANAENLTLIGAESITGTGNALDNILVGNDADNALNSGAGNDVLNGGAGADSMQGGTGNDVYVVDSTSDVVSENAGEGMDLVRSTVGYVLSANVENLTLFGTDNLSGGGNALDNTLIGNGGGNALSSGAGNDTINGGAGADTMQGGAGDDIYTVDDSGDILVESLDQGIDLVRASIAYTLGANLESLTLIGTDSISGNGNSLDNIIIGNSANNVLTGDAGNDTINGGAGDDTMQGGVGNDRYIVNSAADVVSEDIANGTDTVESLVTWTLGANIENLTLTGAGNRNGTGNALDNLLVGNSGNNTLTGQEGNDTYQGNAGNDTLVDSSASSNDVFRWGLGQGNDSITDAGGEDRIEIAAGVTADQLNLVRSGNNLRIEISGATDVLTVVNWYTGAANRIEEIRLADGSTVNVESGAPQSIVATSASREAIHVQRGITPPQTGRAMLVATDLDRDRSAQLLVQAMAQFDGGTALGDPVERVRRPEHSRIDLAASL